MVSFAVDVETDVANDKNAIPSFDNARTILIWADVLFVGRMWACVKTDWIAIVRDLPLARRFLKLLLSAESTWTC